MREGPHEGEMLEGKVSRGELGPHEGSGAHEEASITAHVQICLQNTFKGLP